MGKVLISLIPLMKHNGESSIEQKIRKGNPSSGRLAKRTTVSHHGHHALSAAVFVAFPSAASASSGKHDSERQCR